MAGLTALWRAREPSLVGWVLAFLDLVLRVM